MIHMHTIRKLKPKESFVLVDFDRTLTSFDSAITWGVLRESSYIDSNFGAESKALYNFYRSMTIDQPISFRRKETLLDMWYDKTADLFEKYHICDKTIDRILKSSHGLKLRKDTKHFLNRMHALDIPVVIVSSGIGNIIEKYLTLEHCLYDNMSIYSNFFIYEGERIVGVKEPLIHAVSKEILNYPEIEGRKSGLLFGDQIEDKKMGNGLNTIDIGFCDTKIHSIDDFKEQFDVVLTENSSFDEVGKVYIKGY